MGALIRTLNLPVIRNTITALLSGTLLPSTNCEAAWRYDPMYSMLLTFDGHEVSLDATDIRDRALETGMVKGVTGAPVALGIVEDASRYATIIARFACADNGFQVTAEALPAV